MSWSLPRVSSGKHKHMASVVQCGTVWYSVVGQIFSKDNWNVWFCLDYDHHGIVNRNIDYGLPLAMV